MVNYRYLGYGITNEQGIATLDHDANGDPITHSYTGTGAGELDIIASLDDNTHISESSIQSETYTTIDCILKDMATQSSHNDAMWAVARGQLNRGTEDTELVLNSGQSNVMAYFNLTNSDSFVIEFDCILDYSQQNGIQLRSADWTVEGQLNINNLSKDTYHHVKCSVSNGTVSWTIDDSNPIINSINNVGLFNFNKTSSDNYFKFKNFKYYPI